MHTASIKSEYVFDVPPYALYERIVDEKMWRGFTQQDAVFKLEVEAPFKLFGGMVEGRVVAFENNKLLKMKWRFKDWKEEDFSTVVLDFATGDASDETVVSLEHSGIPKKSASGNEVDMENYRKGWLSQVFEPISKILGLPLKKYELNK